jgi:putative ABC transport system substrate-binding protein
MAYSIDPASLWRGAAEYVDRILRGAKIDELPIQQPTAFVFDINLGTAKALGLTVPRELLVQAREVIE